MYKKDKKLAIQVAKTLGYKIKVKAEDGDDKVKEILFAELPKEVQSIFKKLVIVNKIQRITIVENSIIQIYIKRNAIISLDSKALKYLFSNKYFSQIEYSNTLLVFEFKLPNA